MISNFLYFSFSTLYSSSLWRTDTVVFAKWNKLPLLNKPPPASIETPSNRGAYWRIHDIQVDNALYINRDTVSSVYDAMHDGAIMVSVHSLTQDSQMFQAGREQVKTCFFFNLFDQVSGRIWTVVGSGYFSYAISYRENLASARSVSGMWQVPPKLQMNKINGH